MILACSGGDADADGTLAVRVREGVPALALAPVLRDTVRAIDGSQPVTGVRTIEQDVRQGISSRWFDGMVIASLAALALVLALGGLYAVTAYSVAQRTREIGVRMALGADRASVMKLVLQQSGILAGAGVVLGVLAAAPLVRVLSAMLFEVQPLDAAVFTIVAVLTTAVAMLATVIPARRASRVDPMVALRAE
jgi:putative ABC transport system permease protein